MTSIKKLLYNLAVVSMTCSLLVSCSMEEPFKAGGEGTLSLTTDIRGNVVKTRAIAADELTALRNKCVVYIENNQGVIRKYKGLDNIPSEIKLRTGSYVAEAWSGDSVSASFDSKFYRGWQRFEMQEGANSLTLRCNIANVIVSVDPASLDVNLTDMKVTFSHSRGELVFDRTNIEAGAKGYFMMPNADKNLTYKVEGKKSSGEAYEKTGVIENVQRAHEYAMTITEEEAPVTEGGALIRLTIADIPVIEEEVEIFTAPAIRGVDFDIESQVVSKDHNFQDTRVYIRGYFGLGSVIMTVSDNFTDLQSGMNLTEGSVQTDLSAKGIRVERRTSTDAATSLESGVVTVDEMYVTFSKAFLDALADSDEEYKITFEATDARHNTTIASLRFANTENAEEHLAPVGLVDADVFANDMLAVRATRATLSANVFDPAAAQNYGIKYREQGASEWTAAYPASGARAKHTRATVIPYSVTVTGLNPGTTYEFIAFCDGFDGSDVQTFTTETPFASIPNGSFEDWSTYSASTLLGTKNVTLPWSVGDKEASFWGSGNEGSATANKTLTNKTTDMLNSGTYAVKLQSDEALSILAAGNIFIGHYVETDGTNGVLSLGREYNGTHPDKMTMWVNYRPATGVKVNKGEEANVPDGFAGGSDHGQIYVALTTAPVEIRTNPSKRKLFDAEGDETVLAYGQVTWTEAFGPDGQLQKIEIPFTYNERAKTKKPVYLVMVASASKYGDYFSGAKGSVIYLDDVELVYE